MSFDWDPVYHFARDSIFTVRLIPSEDENAADELANRAKLVGTVGEDEDVANLVKQTMITTGFSVGECEEELGILTAAHSLGHLFKASDPLTVQDINRLFTVRVSCGHYENAFLQAAGSPEDPRQYAIGRVIQIDCRCDLILVAAPLPRVFGGGQCHAAHPTLDICVDDGLDPATHECLLVSWPLLRPDLMSLGRISRMRRISDLCSPNKCEYEFDALEVQMVTGAGSSGGPLVNRTGQLIGVLHGSTDTHSYFVAFHHVREFLEPLVA